MRTSTQRILAAAFHKPIPDPCNTCGKNEQKTVDKPGSRCYTVAVLNTSSDPAHLLDPLYSLWIAVGLYAYLEQTSQSGMKTIVDLIKGMVGK
jgi:hypothetical protein